MNTRLCFCRYLHPPIMVATLFPPGYDTLLQTWPLFYLEFWPTARRQHETPYKRDCVQVNYDLEIANTWPVETAGQWRLLIPKPSWAL